VPKVLIAEDDLMIADMAEMVLVEHGYEVCGIARTVPEAVALGRHHKPDLAVFDQRLADGGLGTEIAAQLERLTGLASYTLPATRRMSCRVPLMATPVSPSPTAPLTSCAVWNSWPRSSPPARPRRRFLLGSSCCRWQPPRAGCLRMDDDAAKVRKLLRQQARHSSAARKGSPVPSRSYLAARLVDRPPGAAARCQWVAALPVPFARSNENRRGAACLR